MLASYISPSNRRFASALNSCVLTSPSFAAFTPLSLFSGGVQGVWYDPSDLTTMFEDSAGTTAVHTPGNGTADSPVGLLLDKSQGLAIGPELTVNGDFSTDTNWTKGTGWTISGGTANLLVTAGYPYITQSATLVVGTTYKVSVTMSNRVAGFAIFRAAGGSYYGPDLGANQTYTFYFTAKAGDNQIGIADQLGNGNYSIDNISVKAVAGNHATQSTSTKRPTLSAKYNLLTYTEDFSNAAWTLSAILPFGSGSVVDATTSPTNTLTADLITPSAGSGRPRVYRVSSITTKSCTYSIFVKSNGYYKVGIRESASVGAGAAFDLSTGSVIGAYNAGSSTVSNLSISSYNNGWYLISCVISFASDTAQGFGVHVLSPSYAAGDDLANAWTPNGTDGIYIWGADLRVTNDGVGLPAYQRVVDANTYDSAGFPYYLKFDGVDDELVPATIDRTSWTGGLCVTGSRALGGQGAIVSGLSGSNLRNGEPYSDGLWYCSFGSDIRSQINIEVGVSPFNKTYVLRRSRVSGTTNFAGNGVLNVTSNTGTTTFSGPESFTIGSTTYGGSIFYNGRIYGVIVSGATPTAVQITNTESWMNGKTKAY